MDHATTAIDQTVVIPAQPDQVYHAYTDPAEHAAFTGAEATGEAKLVSHLPPGVATSRAPISNSRQIKKLSKLGQPPNGPRAIRPLG